MLSINNYISHRWQDENKLEKTRSLTQHLFEVGTAMSQNIQNFPNSDKNFEKIGIITGVFHDFGKFTTYFQNYIQFGKKSEYKEHAFISALYGAFYSHKIGLDNEDLYIVYSSILHHHSNLCNVDEDIGQTKIIEGKLYSPDQYLNKRVNTILKEQIADLSKNQQKINLLFSEVIRKFNAIFETEETFLVEFLRDGYIEIFNILVKFRSKIYKKQIDESVSLKLIYVFSSLIDSDKFSAAGIQRTNHYSVDPSIVDLYRQNKFNLNDWSSIINMRNQIYEEIKNSISKLDLKNHILTITAPTGSGKTIASIMAALKISKKIDETQGKVSRIIYSMPFVTLLEQNFKVSEEIFSSIPDFSKNPQKYIISHYHLSDPTYLIDGEELPVEKALLLVESWDSFFIVTTFVQLFESMISNNNKKLKKVHNIANSIIIIDEIQSIKVELWPTIRDILTKFSKEFNVYFIIMSATLPEIYSESIELSGSKIQIQERFKSLKRVDLHIDITPCSIEEAVISKESYFGMKSILFIFNTIESSIQAFSYLQEYIKSIELTLNLYYISGNLTPRDREEVINKILMELKNGERPIVIGTQIFEAGVDIDFDVVVRDISPIDSIIQSSGRANRNGKYSKGEVFVIDVSKDQSSFGYFSKLVYGKIHTEVSMEILQQFNGMVIEEGEVNTLVMDYYRRLKEKYLEGDKIYINALNNLSYGKGKNESGETYSSDFKIIEKYPECGIFVEEDEEATSVLLKFLEIKMLNDPIVRKKEFIRIRRDFYKFLINIDERKMKKYGLTCHKEGNLYIMYRIVANSQYDRQIGIMSHSQEGLVE